MYYLLLYNCFNSIKKNRVGYNIYSLKSCKENYLITELINKNVNIMV